jgi:hypothetical protein
MESARRPPTLMMPHPIDEYEAPTVPTFELDSSTGNSPLTTQLSDAVEVITEDVIDSGQGAQALLSSDRYSTLPVYELHLAMQGHQRRLVHIFKEPYYDICAFIRK